METIAVVFICLVGSVYSLFVFRDCLKSWRKERVGTNSSSPRRPTRRARRTLRFDLWTQAISGAVFLGVAAALVASLWQDLRQFAHGPGDGDLTPWSVEIPGMLPVPGLSVLRDNARPGRPIWCVNLGHLPATDVDIQALVKAGSEIKVLILNGTNVTSEGLTQLRRLPRLKSLSLDVMPITDSDCKELAQIASLEALSLHDTQVTDEGLVCLQDVPHLKVLALTRTRVTDDGCRHLAQIESLEELSLEGTQITDAGVEHLARLSNLQSLNLTGTAITDASAASLQKLHKLEFLHLYETDMTRQGIQALKAKLPHLNRN